VDLVDNGSDVLTLADGKTLLLFETNFAKEARNRIDCWGKPLGCSFGSILGIAVWTKW
jgi:hypothetical protein